MLFMIYLPTTTNPASPFVIKEKFIKISLEMRLVQFFLSNLNPYKQKMVQKSTLKDFEISSGRLASL